MQLMRIQKLQSLCNLNPQPGSPIEPKALQPKSLKSKALKIYESPNPQNTTYPAPSPAPEAA